MSARPRKEIDLSSYEGRFAARLKSLREKAKMTVEEAAERMSIAPTTIYGWETGYRQPRVAEFPKISEIYKVKKAKDILPNE